MQWLWFGGAQVSQPDWHDADAIGQRLLQTASPSGLHTHIHALKRTEERVDGWVGERSGEGGGRGRSTCDMVAALQAQVRHWAGTALCL